MMTSVVVSDGGGNIVEYVTVMEDPQQVNLLNSTSAKNGPMKSCDKTEYVKDLTDDA